MATSEAHLRRRRRLARPHEQRKGARKTTLDAHCRWRHCARGKGNEKWEAAARHIEIMCVCVCARALSVFHLHRPLRHSLDQPRAEPVPPPPTLPVPSSCIRQPVNQQLLRSLPHFLIYAGNESSRLPSLDGCVCIVVGRTAHAPSPLPTC